MKKKLLKLLIWLGIFNLVFAGSLLANFKQAKADTLPTVQFDRLFAKGSASISRVNIAVDLSAVNNNDTTVDYAVIDSGTTAVKNINYTLDDGTLTIPSGDLSADIQLNIIDNHLCDKSKTIEIGLSNPTNATLGIPNDFTYKILQDDCGLQTTLTTNPAAPDGQNGWFITDPTITLTAVGEVKTFYQWDGKIAAVGRNIQIYF